MIPILKLWEMTQIGELMLRFVNYSVDQQTILTCPAMSPCHVSCDAKMGPIIAFFLQNHDVMDYFLLAAIFIQDPMNDLAPPLQKIHQYDETRTAMSTWNQLWKLVPILVRFFWESTYSWWFGPLRYDAIKSEPLTVIATPECIAGFVAQFTMRFYLHV